MPDVLISIVVPVFSGKTYLPELIRRISELRERFRETRIEITECICVDDESVDNSLPVLRQLGCQYPWVQVLALSRNFGQHPATIAGIQHSSGDWVVTVDEDLQHDPALIPVLLHHACAKSLDVVYAMPESAVHQSVFRDMSSRLTKRFVAMLTKNPHIETFSSFRVMRGSVARAAAASCATETYFDVAVTWFTSRMDGMSLSLKDRRFISEKRSGYTFLGLVKHANRLLLTADNPIMRYGFLIGIISASAAFAGTMIVLYSKIFRPDAILVPGWASLMVVSLFLFSALSLQLSLAVKLLSLLMHRFQGRPTYFIVNRELDSCVLETLDARACQANEITGLAQ